MTEEQVKSVLSEAARKFGTPLYVFFPERMRRNIGAMKRAFEGRYKNFQLCYAAKTNFIPQVVNCAYQAGAYPEVIPGIETDVISRLGIWDRNTVVNGPLKLERELRECIARKSIINIDNATEFEVLNKIASDMGVIVECGLRIKRDTELQYWSRFGFNIDNGDANLMLEKIRKDFPALRINGLHFHMGTNNNDVDFYRKSSEAVSKWAMKSQNNGLISIDYLDLGGGFSSDCPLRSKKDGWKNPTDDEYAEALTTPILELFPVDARPRLIIESGRRLVDDCFIFLTSVMRFAGAAQSEVILDGTAAMFPSAAHRAHKISVLERRAEYANRAYKIYGGSPVHFDCFSEEENLQELAVGDVLAVENAGAYSMNMATSFVRYLPRVVAYEDEKFSTIFRERSYDDLFHDECGSAA